MSHDLDSSNFDDQLRRLADAASSAARPLPADEVRRLGHRRRVRRTVGATAAVAIAIAGVGGGLLAQSRSEGALPAASQVIEPPTVPGPVPSVPAAEPTATTTSNDSAPAASSGATPQSESLGPVATASAGAVSPSPLADPLGPGSVARMAAPAPGRTDLELAARQAMLTTDELPTSRALGLWVSSDRTFPVNCAPYSIPGHSDVMREDRYSAARNGGAAWQEILVQSNADGEADALYESRLTSAASCSPSNASVTLTLSDDADRGAVYSYTTRCKSGVTQCGDLSFVVGVAQRGNVVVYLQFSGYSDIDASAGVGAMRTVLSRLSPELIAGAPTG